MNDPVSVAPSSRLAVVYRPVNDLTPDPRNARTHPKRQIDQLRASDLPPLKWSSLKYVFRMEDTIDGKEEAYG
ncbi:hypothetical protein [Nitrobacter sp. TKz-YC01]|uniref:hypothetical protein n=1 Tax=Nitrobacter sp. TKz-YC01 TaxID=3398703 RepID=UPI003A0FC824